MATYKYNYYEYLDYERKQMKIALDGLKERNLLTYEAQEEKCFLRFVVTTKHAFMRKHLDNLQELIRERQNNISKEGLDLYTNQFLVTA